MTLRLIKTFTGLSFNITDYVDPTENKDEGQQSAASQEESMDDLDDNDDVNEDELDAEFEDENKQNLKKARKGSDMDEEDSGSEVEFPQRKDSQGDEIKNELERVKPRLAIFKCVGIGLKNNSREMA